MRFAIATGFLNSLDDIEHAIVETSDSALRDVEGLVLRCHPTLWQTLCSEATAPLTEALVRCEAQVHQRVSGLKIVLLPDISKLSDSCCAFSALADPAPRLLFSGQQNAQTFTPLSDEIRHAVQQEDLRHLIAGRIHRCVVSATTPHHFVLPSGAHTNQFLRLSEAFVDLESVDRAAYWIALSIQAQSASDENPQLSTILVDHPSMLILGSRVQRLLKTSASNLRCLPSYPSSVETRAATVQLVQSLAQDGVDVTVLIGVALTGRLGRFVRTYAPATHATVRPIVLFALKSIPDIEVLCELELPGYQSFPSGVGCELCQPEASTVAVNGSSYLIGYGEAHRVGLPPELFDQQRKFLTGWGAVPGVLRVHYRDPNEANGRHHAFYVDVATLLRQTAFRSELASEFAKLEPRPDCILFPDHNAAQSIAALAADVLSVPQVALSSHPGFTFADLPVVDQQTLLSAHSLLVVDDILVTGSRLESINRLIRGTYRQACPGLRHIHYRTALALPPSSYDYGRRRMGIVSRHEWGVSLEHLYKFSLPSASSIGGCPWCREREILSRLARLSSSPTAQLNARLAELAREEYGLTDGAFYLGGDIPKLPALEPQSAILPADSTPLQVLFACASAVQQAREKSTNPLAADRFPIPGKIGAATLESLYTERMIWLCLLRSLRGAELHDDFKDLIQTVSVRCAQGNEPTYLTGELAVALVSGKADRLVSSDAIRQLFQRAGIPWAAVEAAGSVDS